MIINLQAVRNGTSECKLLIINHDKVLSTSCTFLIDQLLTISIVWGHVITSDALIPIPVLVLGLFWIHWQYLMLTNTFMTSYNFFQYIATW